MSMQHGITHWCALMEPTLLRMLAAMAIRFKPIGPMVEFRGRRQPCYIDLSEMLNAVLCERPTFWEMITDGGSLRACAEAAALDSPSRLRSPARA
jgi:N-acyl amino acid synthase of PEP-CTERM/exosortase system